MVHSINFQCHAFNLILFPAPNLVEIFENYGVRLVLVFAGSLKLWSGVALGFKHSWWWLSPVATPSSSQISICFNGCWSNDFSQKKTSNTKLGMLNFVLQAWESNKNVNLTEVKHTESYSLLLVQNKPKLTTSIFLESVIFFFSFVFLSSSEFSKWRL